MNKKPMGLASRHPDFYPVFPAVFDTHRGVEGVLSSEWWDSEPPPYLYWVDPISPTDVAARLDPEGWQIADEPTRRLSALETEGRLQQMGGVGGIHILGRWTFEQFAARSAQDPLIAEMLRDLKGTEKLDSIEQIAVITINSGNGGTGSGGAPFVTKFLRDEVKAPSLSLNVTVLPSAADMRSKVMYRAHALASLHALIGDSIDGVILADNGELERNFGAHNDYQKNFIIHEMLTPFLVSPMGTYSSTGWGGAVDQNDILRRLRPAMGKTALCTIGLASVDLNEALGAAPADTLRDLISRAADALAAPVEFLPETTFVAILTAPALFYEAVRKSTVNPSDSILEGITDAISAKVGARVMHVFDEVRGRDGQVGLLEFPTAETVSLTVLYSAVRSHHIDDLVAAESTTFAGGDGWSALKEMSASEVDAIARQELMSTVGYQRRSLW